MDALLFTFIIIIAVGIGTLASLFGIGGGFLLLPTMTMVVGLTTHEAVATIPLTIIFMSASSTMAYTRQKRVDFTITAIIFSFTILGSIIGAFMVELASGQVILVLFGLVEAILALILALVKTPQERYKVPSLVPGNHSSDESSLHAERNGDRDGDEVELQETKVWYMIQREHVDAIDVRHVYTANLLIAVPLSFVAGFLSSLLGIGGGTLYIQIFVFTCGMSIHMAIASSMASILISAIASFATFAGNSIVNPAALGQVDYLVAIAYGIGMVVGAQIGALVSKKLSSKRLKPMAASMILVIATLMILKALLNP